MTSSEHFIFVPNLGIHPTAVRRRLLYSVLLGHTSWAMMATSLTTMDLYARDYVEPRARPKVALLEIGGVEATCYATGVCNESIDVAEPLFYSDLQWAERMRQCDFGPIETATIRQEPAELWLHVSQAWICSETKKDAEFKRPSTDNFEKAGRWYFSASPGNELYGKRPQQAGRTQATPLSTTTTTTGTSTFGSTPTAR